jgi:hypothetical protein
MAKRTKESSETPVARKAPARRKAVGTKSTRKAQPAASGQAVEQAEALESGATSAHAGSSPTTDEIAKRAYEIFLRRGSRNGHDMEDWLEAERQLRGSGTR